ncbi:MAG: putative N-acetylmannosamine-6-phosphate 2-epimerase [Vulcanimicrobiaceae bacterium]
MNALLRALDGGLIVSIQPEAGSALNTPEIVAALARCAVANGAVGVRIEGLERLRAVRAAVAVPLVGILKRTHPGFAPYITSTLEEVAAVAEAGAAIVAFDATARRRVGGAGVADLIRAAQTLRCLAMADCATQVEAEAAAAAGADIIATTLAGYTEETRGRTLPDLELLTGCSRLPAFPICEGGVAAPEGVRAAFAAGARAVVVGNALTNIDAHVRSFAGATLRITQEAS